MVEETNFCMFVIFHDVLCACYTIHHGMCIHVYKHTQGDGGAKQLSHVRTPNNMLTVWAQRYFHCKRTDP